MLRAVAGVFSIGLYGSVALAQPARSTKTLSGILVDSITAAPVAGARLSIESTSLTAKSDSSGRFAIAGVANGQHTLEVRTASLDSMTAMHRVTIVVGDSQPALRVRVPNAALFTAAFCGDGALRHPGIVYGRVEIEGEMTPPVNMRVIASWNAAAPDSLERRTNTQGLFRLCGVPVNTPVEVRALVPNTGAAPFPVRVPAIGRMIRADLTLDRYVEAGSVFSGVVMIDSTLQPVAAAEVLLANLGKATFTNEQGAFRLQDVPAGEHHVVVRRVGYAPFDARVAFSGQPVERRLFLQRIVTLDSVKTTAVRGLELDLEENKRLGLGHFYTRDELAKQEGRKLADVLTSTPGLGIVRGRTGAGWVLSRRRPPSLSSTFGPSFCQVRQIDECRSKDQVNYTPDAVERQMGIVKACYSHVYVGGMLMNPGKPTEPFDVNTISIDQIESIEYYAGAAQLPAKYSRLGADCGVLVIHTRRSP